MFKSYFKVGLRNLLLHKPHSAINVAGLAAGITCCLFLVLYINDELSYDRYHDNAGRIYRVTSDNWAKLPPAFAPAMTASYPHLVENTVRFWPLFAPAKLRYKDVVFVEKGGVFADPAVFSVFSWPMIAGNPSTALGAANAVVLTRSMARKYFGDRDPLGETVEFWGRNITVTGVIEDVPKNSHLRFDFLLSFASLSGVWGNGLDEKWDLPVFYTYVLTGNGVSAADVEGAAKELFDFHKLSPTASPTVQAIESIHLHSDLEGEFSPGGNVTYLYTLATAAIIVLLLACINFTNLTTARAATRTKEVGIRKVMGARRRQLIGQFFGEALMLSIVAFAIAVGIVNLALPAFNHLAGKAISFRELSDPFIMVGVLAVMLLVGLVAGAYPAIFLSRFKPVSVLKASGDLRVSNLFVRKGLIVFQFSVTTVFFICMAGIVLQLRFLQNKDLGFDRAQVLVMDADNFPRMRDGLQSVAGVEHVAGVPQVLGGQLPSSPFRAEGVQTDSLSEIRHYGVTQQFVQTMGMTLLAGRNFIDGSGSDELNAVILNASAVSSLGWLDPADAIGKSFSIKVPPLNGGNDVWREGKIVGVLKDFHYDVLYKQIEPLVLYPSYDMNLAFVRVKEVNASVLGSIKDVWDRVNPDAPFTYYYLDDHLKQKYVNEEKLGSLMAAATVLAGLIACLGLFALASFSAVQRTKEIGIRKVLGATVTQIWLLLSSDFLKLVCIAVVVAIPVAHFAMSKWMDNFAYHISVSWLLYVAAGAAAVIVALLTVSLQTLRAAKADPAESIRYE